MFFNGELSKDAFATVVEHLLTRPEVENYCLTEKNSRLYPQKNMTMP